jgi:20S proteasome alpha/beta subunit
MIFSGVRPFGVSLLICGYDYDEDRPFLYQCDPSVSFLIYVMSKICIY